MELELDDMGTNGYTTGVSAADRIAYYEAVIKYLLARVK